MEVIDDLEIVITSEANLYCEDQVRTPAPFLFTFSGKVQYKSDDDNKLKNALYSYSTTMQAGNANFLNAMHWTT